MIVTALRVPGDPQADASEAAPPTRGALADLLRRGELGARLIEAAAAGARAARGIPARDASGADPAGAGEA